MRAGINARIMKRYETAGIGVRARVMLLFYFLLIAVVLLGGLIIMNIVLADSRRQRRHSRSPTRSKRYPAAWRASPPARLIKIRGWASW